MFGRIKFCLGDYDMKKIITYTTRPKRINEIDDVDYHFVSEERFLELKERYGCKYGFTEI